MKILYYDCFAGISGDMNLGALVDLGVPDDYLITELKKLKLSGYELKFEAGLKMGISGTKATVTIENLDKQTTENEHVHGHNHGHEQHLHEHLHLYGENHAHNNDPAAHVHRNLDDIQAIITGSDLNSFVKEKSLQVFYEIAIAEAKIHAKDINEIHFHEVGAIDSIVDIVGAAICIDYLKPAKVVCSTVELGGGLVQCAHGVFPVPAPATAEILKGIPVKKGAANKETTTPTGAAILKVYVDEFIDRLDFSIEKIAYGIGHRDLEIPNVLRVYAAEGKQEDSDKEQALLLESNIDDMNPEYYEFIIDRLFDAGAQDVYLIPIIMKKSRPAVKLSVLCDNTTRQKIEEIILTETTSLGLRTVPVLKSILERTTRSIDTVFGTIQIKEAFYHNKSVKYKAEYEDCILAARKHSVSLKEIYTEVDRVVEQMKAKV
jgi:pyridinium-3,5-bisthiocarboxylic acid mononucleotide nickel chelatase